MSKKDNILNDIVKKRQYLFSYHFVKSKVMNVEKYRKQVEERLKADRAMKEIGKVLQEYDDQRQDLRIERAEIFQPITTHVEEVKKSIDDRQDKLLEKITENQNTLATAIIGMAPTPTASAPLLPIEGFASSKFTETLGTSSPKYYTGDIDKNFTPEEIQRLTDYQLPPPTQVMKSVMDKVLDLKEYDKSLAKQLQDLGRKKGHLSKSKKSKEENALAIDDLTSDIKLIQKYKSRIKLLYDGQPLLSPSFTGSGARKYKQSKRNAYKIDSDSGQYGGLMINVPRLMNEMVVEAVKGGSIVYERPADKSFINLLTKKYKSTPNAYSSRAIQIFQDLTKLANIPKQRPSGKKKLLQLRDHEVPPSHRGGQIYYTSPEDLMKRLTLLTGTRFAGNTNLELRNEISEILDHLLKNEIITKKQYDDYIKKHMKI